MTHYVKPVVGKDFFAREDLLRHLTQSANDIQQGYRQNIALIGSGLIGKSSLLLQFLNSIKNTQELLPVYLNARDTNLEKFMHDFAAGLLYQALKKKPDDEASYRLDDLLKESSGVFPKSCDLVRRVRSFIAEKRYDEAYSELWDLCVLLNAETGRFPVLVLDEFSLLSEFPVAKPFRVLGQKIMVQQKTLFFVSSSFPLNARKILAERLSLLFGGFKRLDVGTFSADEARKFLTQRCRSVVIPNEIKDFILAFTNGHPFYLSSIAGKIDYAKGYGMERITLKSISRIIAELLFYPGGAIDQFFSEILDPIHKAMPERNVFDMLSAMAKQPVRARDILNKNTVSSSDLNKLLNSLAESSLIKKSGALYSADDAVFRMWIEVKSTPRNLCFDFVPQQERADYAKEVESRISVFYAERKKSLDKRIAELISSFDNDHFFIDERTRVLPRVNSIELKHFDHKNLLISAKGKKRCLFIISQKRLTQEDVCGICSRIKSLRYRKPKVVLIAPEGIEPPAKLAAKQKQFCIWSKDDMARLFKFYKGYNALIA